MDVLNAECAVRTPSSNDAATAEVATAMNLSLCSEGGTGVFAQDDIW